MINNFINLVQSIAKDPKAKITISGEILNVFLLKLGSS